MYLVRRDFQVFLQNVCVVVAGADDGARHPVENAHEPKHVSVHPLRFHERLCVSRDVGAVVAKNLDARNPSANADGPGARAWRLEFNHVDRVALEQA